MGEGGSNIPAVSIPHIILVQKSMTGSGSLTRYYRGKWSRLAALNTGLFKCASYRKIVQVIEKSIHLTKITNVFDEGVIYDQKCLRHKPCTRVRGSWKDNKMEIKEMLCDGVNGKMYLARGSTADLVM
jgi:hypothetical protein